MVTCPFSNWETYASFLPTFLAKAVTVKPRAFTYLCNLRKFTGGFFTLQPELAIRKPRPPPLKRRYLNFCIPFRTLTRKTRKQETGRDRRQGMGCSTSERSQQRLCHPVSPRVAQYHLQNRVKTCKIVTN